MNGEGVALPGGDPGIEVSAVSGDSIPVFANWKFLQSEVSGNLAGRTGRSEYMYHFEKNA